MSTSDAVLVFFVCCLLHPTPSLAQISGRDLEGIERHRLTRRPTGVFQSVDAAQDSLRWDAALIGTWDFAVALAEEGEGADAPVATAAADTADLRGRLAVLPQELMVPCNEILEAHVRDYIVRHAAALRVILGRYLFHEPALRAVFRRRGVPEDLTALAIVESAMNPSALSRAGALGMWQFMPETARQYGLRCDPWVDERLDVLLATDAAARYLRAAYGRFGNWPLAVSSYNCGPKAVEDAIRRAGSRDFWKVYEHLPGETKGYMPALVAAMYSVYFHDLHGICAREYSEGDVFTFRILRDMTFGEIVRATGMSREVLERLNPQYLAGLIPGSDGPCILRIPGRYGKLFKENIDVVTD